MKTAPPRFCRSLLRHDLSILLPLKDPGRQKNVQETPEEVVRQAMIHYLSETMGVPLGLMAIEKAVIRHGETKRADIVVHDKQGHAWMVVECKAPSVPISQRTLEQVSNYNQVLGAPYIFVTNGSTHLCAEIKGDEVLFLESLPEWS